MATSVDGTDALLGGLVGVSGSPHVAGDDDDDNGGDDSDDDNGGGGGEGGGGDGPGLVLDVLGAWNSVKNGSFLADGAARVTLSGFVHADVALGDGGDSSVVLRGAKRGNVVTGGGDDEVAIETASNAFGWVNEFRVATGGGDDTVVVRALDVAAAAAAGDATFAATANGAGAFTGADAGALVFAALGAGDDVFIALGESADRVSGGNGDDILRAGGGADVLAGGAGDDVFFFAAGDGADTVLDFRPGADRLGFGLGRAEARALLDAAVEADGATTISYGADSVLLLGVSKSLLTADDLV